jgi:hypothetical protein
MVFKRFFVAVVAALLAVLSLSVIAGSVAQAHQASTPAPPQKGQLPNAVPSAITPQVDDGAVWSVAQVGNTMVIGGSFTSVGGQSRPGVAAFDATTGTLSATFTPNVAGGQVYSVLPGPDSNSVYVGGAFTSINGQPAQYVALLNLTTGQVVPTFTPPAFDYGMVRDMAVAGNRLILGGFFAHVGGKTHNGLATLNATTGALDPYLSVQLAGHHNQSGSGAQGYVGPWALDVSPDGSRLVVTGNFKTADGLLRDQLVMIDLNATSAVVDPNWATQRYSPLCFSWAFDGYTRGVTFAPDSSYFVVNATGGGNPGTLCDATSRFETASVGTNIQPTWVDETGGDTVWGVTVTNDAIYVGGHARWMNNPLGVDHAQPGAVPRPGLAALDPVSGRPYSWNPGHNPLGKAVYALLATPTGLWMGYDDNYIGNYKYLRQKIAFFPYAGGATVASTYTGPLPGTVYLGSPSGQGDSLSSSSFDGTNATSLQAVTGSNVPWSNSRGAFMVGNQVFYGSSDGYLYSVSFDGTTFGTPVKIDPYHDPIWDGVDTHDGTTFDGMSPSLYGQMNSVTGMFYAGGRLYYTLANDPNLYSRWFSPDSGIMDETTTTATSSVNFSTADGMFLSGNTLYVVNGSNGSMYTASFANGVVSGTATLVNGPSTGGPNWSNRSLFFDGAPPADIPPTAVFTSSCPDNGCTFDASGSSDPDGSIASYSWDFGDGNSGTGVNPHHTYSAGGQYSVTLTVTDNQGAQSMVEHDVTVSAPPNDPISFIGASHSAPGATLTKSVTIPPSATPGDEMLLVFTTSKTGTWSGPGASWTQVGTNTNTSIVSTLWQRQVVSGDPGSTVSVTSPAYAKGVLSLADYRGVDPTNPIDTYASLGDTGGTSHTTPTVTAHTGDWGVSFWTDKSVAVSQWTIAAGVTQRDTAIDNGPSGRCSMLLGDSAAALSAGPYGGLTSTTDQSSDRAIMWTVLLDPAPTKQPISFVGASHSAPGATLTKSATIPAAATPGDEMLLVFTAAKTSTWSGPGAGWTQVSTTTDATIVSTLWQRQVVAGDPGSTVSVTSSAYAKGVLSLATYHGVNQTNPIDASAGLGDAGGTSHTTPTVAANAGDWGVSFWTDKSTAVSQWTIAAGVTQRDTAIDNGPSGRCSMLLGDSAGALSAGSYGGFTSTTDQPSDKAIMWTVALAPVVG